MVAVAAIGFAANERHVALEQQMAQDAANERCRESNNDSCQNLVASVRASSAAEDTVNVGYWQLGLNGVGLFGLFFTVLYARSAWKEARRSANVSERALTELERPFVVGTAITGHIARSADHVELGEITIQVLNIGRTPAILRRIIYKFDVVARGSIIERTDPAIIGGRELPEGVFSKDGEPYAETENLRLSFFYDRQDIANLKQTIWMTGFVRYESIFGTHYISGFTLAYDLLSSRFVRRGGTSYNYSREEQPEDIPEPSDS